MAGIIWKVGIGVVLAAWAGLGITDGYLIARGKQSISAWLRLHRLWFFIPLGMVWGVQLWLLLHLLFGGGDRGR